MQLNTKKPHIDMYYSSSEEKNNLAGQKSAKQKQAEKDSNEIKHAARVLSRYRDARRTRILRIRLRLTVRVNKKRMLIFSSSTSSFNELPLSSLLSLSLCFNLLFFYLSDGYLGLDQMCNGLLLRFFCFFLLLTI